MKTALITGVSRGIGKALAQKFLAEGYFVIGTSTSGQSPLVDPNLQMFQLDLSKPESIEECAARIVSLGKKVDVLINNAGIAVEEEVESPTIVTDYLRKTLEVNLIGTIDFSERVLSLLNDDGHIINVSSRAGSLGDSSYTENYPTYRISKAALNMFTRILSDRLKGKAIVSSVHPGWVRTDMGGEEAPMSPEEAADHIFQLATSKVETGQFWFKGDKFPW